jgi:hypothetical protein
LFKKMAIDPVRILEDAVNLITLGFNCQAGVLTMDFAELVPCSSCNDTLTSEVGVSDRLNAKILLLDTKPLVYTDPLLYK